MPEEIFKPFTGRQVIKVDGVCYEWVEFTPNASETPGAITEEHDQCSDCSPDVILYEYSPCIFDNSSSSSSSSVFVPFPPSCAGCGSLGDVHWVWGNDLSSNGNDMASFNVDDNAGTSEIVWFTFTEGATEYSIKYTQQEFPFTEGGKAISQVTVSETGQPDIVYSLTPSQDGVLKDGLSFSEPDTINLGTGACTLSMGSRTIDDSSKCVQPGNFFSLLQMKIEFKDGLYNADEIGGALYYIWKTAKDESGAVNTTSEAGIDALGDYLATGSTGFTSRSDFEVAPSAVRETVNPNTLGQIATRIDELNSLNGSVNFDWDPLMDDDPTCTPCEVDNTGSPAICGSVPQQSDPSLFMTLCWDDATPTRSFLDCTWTNGETKEVFPGSYGKHYYPTNTNGWFNTWRRRDGNNGTAGVLGMELFVNESPPTSMAPLTFNAARIRCDGPSYPGAQGYMRVQYNKGFFGTFPGTYNYGLSPAFSGGPSFSPTAYQLPQAKEINSAMNGFYSTVNGITVRWELGNGW